ncbi:unnamed protein product [Brachionus calyciflorus]|uniref:Uncharacterized protein n=1 Tax=Brachionus calyciflorus TaxID=104777 RepID=A0A814PZH9_9BILA|nr:unnamed protein product [Brachionus calyciflorus]
MLSYSSSSNFDHQNLYSNYCTSNTGINAYSFNALLKEDNYDQAFGFGDGFFDNFLAGYNNGREYEKTDYTSERLRVLCQSIWIRVRWIR